MTGLKRILLGLAFAALMTPTLTLPASAADAAAKPEDVIQRYDSVLLDTMREATKLGIKGRYEKLKPEITADFNLPLMARTTVGAYWDSMSDDQRKKFVDAFSRFSVANYANRFDGYSGEQIKVVGTTQTPRGDTLVNTDIVKPDGDKVAINYLMRQDGNNWRVVDVFLSGSISELATRRSEYTSVIQDKGVDGLIQAIEAKTDQLLSGSA